MSDAGISILRKGLEKKLDELESAKALYNAAEYEGPMHLHRKLAAARAAEAKAKDRQAVLLERIAQSVERAQKRTEGMERGEIADKINRLEDEVEGIKSALTALGVDPEATDDE
jgi:predicted transcriptional regulator